MWSRIFKVASLAHISRDILHVRTLRLQFTSFAETYKPPHRLFVWVHSGEFSWPLKIESCHNDNLRCHQWRQIWHYDNSRFLEPFCVMSCDAHTQWCILCCTMQTVNHNNVIVGVLDSPGGVGHRPHSRQVTGARCTGGRGRYSAVRSETLTWREWGLWGAWGLVY